MQALFFLFLQKAEVNSEFLYRNE